MTALERPTPAEFAPPEKKTVNLVLDTHIDAALTREALAMGEDRSAVVRTILRQYFGLGRHRSTVSNISPAP